MNSINNNGDGLSIDFDSNTPELRVYLMSNGSAQRTFYISLNER